MGTKPSIVFAHGLWADGSCFSKLIPTLQAEGHEVVAAQNSLDTLKGDVAAVTRALGRVRSPAILVPLRLKRGDQFAEARAVGPESVGEHDARFGVGHGLLLNEYDQTFAYRPACAAAINSSGLVPFPLEARAEGEPSLWAHAGIGRRVAPTCVTGTVPHGLGCE